MTAKETADHMLHRMDSLTDSMGTDEGYHDAMRFAALESLNNMIEECAKIAENMTDGVHVVYCTGIATVLRSLKADNSTYDLSR